MDDDFHSLCSVCLFFLYRVIGGVMDDGFTTRS